MRSLAGENALQDIIENRSLLSHKLTNQLNQIVDYWGIYVEICSMKEINIDP